MFRVSSATKPTALGTLLQSSTYGSTIPTIYGTSRLAPLAIWAANLRQGDSGKKGKSKTIKGKKGPPTYVENIDFLLGSNPILGVLQIWENQNAGTIMNFVKADVTLTGLPPFGQITVDDPLFYAPVAVTADIQIGAQNFNDYGSFGEVSIPTAIYEVPLWNLFQNGPDLVDQMYSKWYPFLYKWAPGDGATITLPTCNVFGTPWASGEGETTFHVYYAQLSVETKLESPLAYTRLTFESELGNGTEYEQAGLSDQQIIYPFYAGVGSPDLDLGTAAAIPSLRLEVQGSYGMLAPRGDAQFADMVEDLFKSGMIQTAAGIGLIQRGVNCNELPGPVQKGLHRELEPYASSPIEFYQPNFAGSLLFGFSRWRDSASADADVTIGDTNGNAWTPIVTGNGTIHHYGLWYANSIADSPAGNVVTMDDTVNDTLSFDNRSFILEIDQGYQEIDATATAAGTLGALGGNIECSIETTGETDLILAFIYANGSMTSAGGNGEYILPQHWSDVFDVFNTPNQSGYYYVGNYAIVASRIVNAPGIYTFSMAVNSGSYSYTIALVAIKAAQPVPYADTLLDILEPVTLMNARLQCLTGGLQGSLTMDSQQTASSWLQQIYTCMDTAPVWSGFVLKSVARSEVSAVGSGFTFIAPTSSGPVANITEADMIPQGDGALVTVTRKAQADALNILQIQHFDRSNAYNQALTSQPESGSIAQYGPRKQSPQNLQMIVDPAVARKVLAIEVRRQTYLRNRYGFTLKAAKGMFLEAMDLVTLNDSQTGISGLPVRLTKLSENASHEFDCEAEPFLYGVNDPNDLDTTILAPYTPSTTITPANVNPPIIFEPPLRMCLSGQPEVWFVVSDSDENYGGSTVYASTDGTSYGIIGATRGNATQGFTEGDWPATPDPDLTTQLGVDLTESVGALEDFTATERDNFEFPCYVQGGAPTPTLYPTITGDYNGPDGIIIGGELTASQPTPPLGGWGPNDLAFVAVRTDWGALYLFGGVPAATAPGTATVTAGGGITGIVCPGLPQIAILPPNAAAPPYDAAMMYFVVQNCGQVSFATFQTPGTPGNNLTGSIDGIDFNLTDVSDGALMMMQCNPLLVLGQPPLLLTLASADQAVNPDGVNGWTSAFYVPYAGFPSGIFLSFNLSQQNGPEPAGGAYELISYGNATLVTGNKWIIDAGSGNEIRRSVFGVPIAGEGVDHPNGSNFAWLNAREQDPVPGIAKVVLDASWIGVDMYFKFAQFNILGGGAVDPSTLTAYRYTPTGWASGNTSSPGSAGSPGNSGQPGQPEYTVSPANPLSNPTATTIDMSKVFVTFAGQGTGNTVYYNARTFTIPAPAVATTYFVTIADPNMLGDTGNSTSLVASVLTNDSLVGVPGNIFIGSITVEPGGGGTITSPGGYPAAEPILVNGV